MSTQKDDESENSTTKQMQFGLDQVLKMNLIWHERTA